MLKCGPHRLDSPKRRFFQGVVRNLRRLETRTSGSSMVCSGSAGNQPLDIAVYGRAFVLAGVGPGVSRTYAAFIIPA